MRPDDFYVHDPLGPGPGRELNAALLRDLRSGPVAGRGDIEVGVALARLVHDDLERFGTGGDEEMANVEMREALLSLRAVVDRLGIEFDPPYRDFSTFKSYWAHEGAVGGGTFRGIAGRGGYQARRDLLSETFDPLHDRLADLETQSLASTLADPISPRSRTGWDRVDAELGELRRHFLNASTSQDYRGIGNDCVHVTEALSQQVYDPERHLRPGESEPPVAQTKLRLDRYVEDAAPGPDNATLRKLGRATIEMAQHVKHSETPTRREAGIAADAVIQLANLLRRLGEVE